MYPVLCKVSAAQFRIALMLPPPLYSEKFFGEKNKYFIVFHMFLIKLLLIAIEFLSISI